MLLIKVNGKKQANLKDLYTFYDAYYIDFLEASEPVKLNLFKRLLNDFFTECNIPKVIDSIWQYERAYIVFENKTLFLYNDGNLAFTYDLSNIDQICIGGNFTPCNGTSHTLSTFLNKLLDDIRSLWGNK